MNVKRMTIFATMAIMITAIVAMQAPALAEPNDDAATLRIYGEDGLSAAFPYTDPEAPFDPQSDEAPPKDFVVFNPAYIQLTGLYASNVDTRMKVFAKQWFVPELVEPVGRVWLDDPNDYVSEDVVTEYTYMFVDKHDSPTSGTAQDAGGSYWTRFWLPIADNDDAQIGIDGCDVNFDGDDDWVVLRDVGDFDGDGRKDIDISTETFELIEGEQIQFLDHMIEVVNVEVISARTPLINIVVDIYYLGNDEPELIKQAFMAQIVPSGYVRAGRHTANNAAPNFYEPWYIKAIATGGDRAYVQVGRLLHTRETFFVDGAEYDVAMIYGPTTTSLKYITIRNPTPEHEDINLEDLSVIKECVMDGELMPLLPPFNRVHDMIDDINIPDSVDDPCPIYYPYGDGILPAYDTVQERRIDNVGPLEIYFPCKDIEPRFDTNLLEILNETYGTATGPVDIVFAMDLTGSMSGELSAMKSESKAIMNAVSVMAPDSRFGLVSYMDYDGIYTTTEPGSTPETYTARYGDTAGSGDYPYKLDAPLTTDVDAVETAMNGLTLGWGADGPQDYSRIIYESYSDSDIGFRPDAVKMLIVIGDAPPHDTNFDYDGDSVPDNTGGDPGRDALMGTSDDLDFQTVVADAADNDIIILAVHGTGYGVEAWKYMAEETSGAYFELDNAAELPDVILDLITIILPVEESWKWLDLHTMPDFYKEFIYPELPDIDGGTGDFLLVSSWRAPNSCDARVMFAYDQATGEQDIYINNYDDAGYNALRLYGEDETYDAAFPYTDPEAPFDPLSDEAPGKDFVTFNPAVMRMSGIVVSNVDSKMKVFARQWFIPEYLEPVGDVWLDNPNIYESEDVITEYTYMFIDKHYMPTFGTALSPGGSYWTTFWMPIADNDDAQIGIDGCDINGDDIDDWVILRDVGDWGSDGGAYVPDGRKDIDISSDTFQLYEGEELTFLDHKMVVKNVEVISGSPPLINMVVDIYYLGNDAPELIAPSFMAQIVPGEYVRSGRHTANNKAPDFYEPWYIKAIATGGDRAYVQVGRLLHTGETFFVDGAEYDVAMIYGPTKDSLKYITIRNPTPEHEDINLEDLSVIKECVMDGELMPLLPPFNRVHDMIDDINIPDSVDDPCPIYYPYGDGILPAYDTVQERRIDNVGPLEIYFPCKDIEPRFDTNLLEILNETYGTATGPVDIVFAMDLTGSMSGELSAMKSESKAIMNAVSVMAPDSRFGLVSYMDYDGIYTTTEPGSTPETYTARYGDTAGSGDYPYKLDAPLTTDVDAVETAMNGLTLGWGADGPQDYSRIIYESYSDSDIGFRPDAVKMLIVIGDAPPHDTNFDYDGDSVPDNTGGDPGRDALMGTSDDLDFQTVVADAADNDIIILAVHGTGYGVEAWKYMAEETSGAYFELDNAAELPDVILDLITIILPVEESWKWLDLHTMPDFYKEFIYPELPDIDGGTGDFLLVSSWRAPNSCDARVMFAYDQATGEQDIYINNYDDAGYNALRLYGEDETYDAAFPYTDPEAPFDPLSDEAPGKDFVTFNPAVMRMSGIVVSNVDSKMKVFARQWFIPEYLEPVGDVWLDNPNIYESEDVITEYTYMFIDKHYMPTFGTALSPGGSYWTTFWMPIADNDDAQIGIDGCDINGDDIDDWVILRDVGDWGSDGGAYVPDGRKDIDISSDTFQLYEGEELTFLDHKMVVKNVEVISGSPPLINMVVDIYYLGNDEPELIAPSFMAQIVPGEYVRAGRHTANNKAPDFYEPWYIKAIATGGDRAYVQIGRLLHTEETFFVDGAEYDVAMIYGPTEDSLKYITIRNPVPEHEDVNLEDLSVIKECVLDGELMPLLPPFNRVHEMVDDISIPDSVDDPCPIYYPYGDEIRPAYDTEEERIISGIPALEIYFTHKDIEPRFNTNLLEILNEGRIESWKWLDIHTMPDFYKEFVYPELPDIDGGEGDWLVTSSFTAPNSCGARVMFAYDAANGTGLYMNKPHDGGQPLTACDYYDTQANGGNGDSVVDKPEAMNAMWDYLFDGGPFGDGRFVKQHAVDLMWAYLFGGWCS